MKFQLVFSTLFVAVNADNLLRGIGENQFACEKNSAGGHSQCDAAKDSDGSACVWCSISSFGACVSQSQAALMKQTIPNLICDGDDGDDDDNTKKDDDSSPSNDDNTDYWKCLETSKEKTCEEASECTWCDTKGGYGICMEKKAAEAAAKSDWFECKLAEEDTVVSDPYDTSCLLATLQGDEASCESTLDVEGQPCNWCQVNSVQVCLNSEQAAIAEQIGGDCGSEVMEPVKQEVLADPYDTSCLLATLSGDEATCESTTDSDGQACEWCEVSSVQVCLTAEQAAIAEQIGGDCSSGARLAVE